MTLEEFACPEGGCRRVAMETQVQAFFEKIFIIEGDLNKDDRIR